jgi:hypothetical protein
MSNDVSIDQEGIDELMRSEDMERLMSDIARDVAGIAEGLAPSRTGRMRSRIKSSTVDGLFGWSGVVSAPAPAGLLSTSSGFREQTRAWGHPVRLWHRADNAFLKRSLTLFSSTGIWDN